MVRVRVIACCLVAGALLAGFAVTVGLGGSGDQQLKTAANTETPLLRPSTTLPATSPATHPFPTSTSASAPPLVTTSLPLEAVPTTRAPETPSTSAAPRGPTPLEPGSEPWGHEGYGAHRLVTVGRTRLDWGIYTRDQYLDAPPGEGLQTTAEIDDPGLIVDVLVDFGDGTTWRPSGGNYGRTCDPSRPRPIYYQAPAHRYTSTGDFAVTVKVTTRLCETGNATGDAGTENVAQATLTARVHPGMRP